MEGKACPDMLARYPAVDASKEDFGMANSNARPITVEYIP